MSMGSSSQWQHIVDQGYRMPHIQGCRKIFWSNVKFVSKLLSISSPNHSLSLLIIRLLWFLPQYYILITSVSVA